MKKQTEEELLSEASKLALERIRKDQRRAGTRVLPLLECLEENLFHPDCNVEFLKASTGTRDNAVATEFYSELGFPPQKYIESCRMETASWLLLRSHLKIWRIAKLLGYSSLGVFSHAFQRWAKMRPSVYRQQCIAKENSEFSWREPSDGMLQRALFGELPSRQAADLIRLLESLYPNASSVPTGIECGLPSGPPRPDWDGKEPRHPPVAGGPHDCFSTKEILQLCTRSSLSLVDEMHLLGGLASGCSTCFRAIERAQSDPTFQEGTGPTIEMLRVLTLYPLEALPVPLRQAAGVAREGGELGIVSLLVESAVFLCWDSPSWLLEELESIRRLIGTERLEVWQALRARIDIYCARSWRRVDPSDEECRRLASVTLETALVQARRSGDPELTAAALAARYELELGQSRQSLREAVQHLPAGHPLRGEWLCELATSAKSLPAALETVLQALAETEPLDETHVGLRVKLFHETAAISSRAARMDRENPPSFGLHLALSWTAHSLSKRRLRTFPFASAHLEEEIRTLGKSLVPLASNSGCWSSGDLEEQWAGLSDDCGLRALELLWLGMTMGCDGFVASHFHLAKSRWTWVSPPSISSYVLGLAVASEGSEIHTLVFTPFLDLIDRLCVVG